MDQVVAGHEYSLIEEVGDFVALQALRTKISSRLSLAYMGLPW